MLQGCVTQLDEYFIDKRTEFSLKINPQGTVFQQAVWKELLSISYGKVRTYMQQTKKLGNVKATRAVAFANGKNPPLYFVYFVSSNYWFKRFFNWLCCKIWRKKWLLEHEGFSKQQSLF